MISAANLKIQTIRIIIKRSLSPIIWGVIGAFGIGLVFYLVQVLGMRSFGAPLYFFKDKWYFVLPLILGFAIQVGLFRAIHLKANSGGGTIAASGGVSTTAMIACCLHNFVAFLPILGLSGVAVFFSTYQSYVFIFSILFVIGGAIYMWRKYNNLHSCCHK